MCILYEKYNNNSGWSSNFNNTSLITQAFSHFSWQYTRGYLMVVDLQGVGLLLTDPQIHCLDRKKYGKGNLGVVGMLMFFMTHCCNTYCKELNLLNPCKDSSYKIDKEFNFYINAIAKPEKPDEIIKKICDLCKMVFPLKSQTFYDQSIKNLNCYCDSCNDKMKKNDTNSCVVCNKKFGYSPYFYKIKKAEPPSRCKQCKKSKKFPKPDKVKLNESFQKLSISSGNLDINKYNNYYYKENESSESDNENDLYYRDYD